MKQFTLAAAVLATASAPAFAGSIERRGDPSPILFEDGKNYLEFTVTSVDPDVSGTARPPIPGGPTGDILRTYQNYALGYKHQFNDRLALALVIDEPVGADVQYPLGTFAFFSASSASIESIQYSGMAKYNATDRVSVYAGLRLLGLSGSVDVASPIDPRFMPTYRLNVDKDYRLGYLLGAAYEIPDMALKVALTYESETEHDFDDNNGDKFEVKLPQAVTLHAQSGIARDTLLFGSVRWREWSEFEVAPADFAAISGGNAIAFGTSDIYTYRLGIGRRFSETWAGAFVLGYETQTNDTVGNLEGTDGFFSYTVALTHEVEAWEVTGALSYIDINNAETSVASFRDNDAFAFSLKVGLRF